MKLEVRTDSEGWNHPKLLCLVRQTVAHTIAFYPALLIPTFFARIAQVSSIRFDQYYISTSAVFNDYVHLTGCMHNKRPLIMGDDTPLIHLLSHSVDGEQGPDLLYTVIVDIVRLCVYVFEVERYVALHSQVTRSPFSDHLPQPLSVKPAGQHPILLCPELLLPQGCS